MRIMVTKERKREVVQQDNQAKKKLDEQLQRKIANPKLAEQLQKRKEKNRANDESVTKENGSQWDSEPMLNFPEYFDYQDFVNPVFRLDLILTSSSAISSQMPGTVQNGDILEFSKREKDTIDDFEEWIVRTIRSYNNCMPRPEFSKVKVVSKKRYEADLEEEQRLKKLNIQIKKPPTKLPSVQNSFINPNLTSSIVGSIASPFNKSVKDFDSLLYAHHDDGKDVFRKYVGRIQVVESDKRTKDLIDENNMGVFAKPYVDKYYEIADPEEQVFVAIRLKVRKILGKHLVEAKRVVELFSQFDHIIKGSMQTRVREFV